jgi:anti-anti-sigma factor
MSVQIDDDKAKISLPNRFDIQVQSAFRKTYADILNAKAISALEIDFSDVIYIDHTALGSLLLLHQRAGASMQNISLTRCQPTVMQTLQMANFHRIFDIQLA